MELQTISQVSKTYGVSVRMLRYYEEEGLIESKRKEGYAYRAYDEAAIKRLQQFANIALSRTICICYTT